MTRKALQNFTWVPQKYNKLWWVHVMTWKQSTTALQNFTSFRLNNKQWWLHVMTWNHKISAKFIWWLHVMTWNHQSSAKFLWWLHVIYGDSSVLQNFTSFRQNNKLYMVTPCYDMKSPESSTKFLWWLHVMTWNHQCSAKFHIFPPK